MIVNKRVVGVHEFFRHLSTVRLQMTKHEKKMSLRKLEQFIVAANRKIKTKNNDQFVAYLDILGFKEMVAISGNGMQIVKMLKTMIKPIAAANKISCYHMSDSLILSIKADSDEALIKLMRACRKLQCNLYSLNNPILLRGAIVKGEYKYDKINGIGCGKAMADAYAHQENYSKYPRVILTRALLDESGISDSTIHRLTFLDEDHYVCIDSLKFYVFSDESKTNHENFSNYIERHLNYAPQSVREKFIWLFNNYKRTIQLKSYKDDRESVKSMSPNNPDITQKTREVDMREQLYNVLYNQNITDDTLETLVLLKSEKTTISARKKITIFRRTKLTSFGRKKTIISSGTKTIGSGRFKLSNLYRPNITI